MTTSSGPLHGLKVIEMAGLAPGPFAAMMLADMGAQVLRIDRPDPAPRAMPQRFYFTDRNRRSIAVDLKSPEGVALVQRLVGGADALIEGFRPGVMERLGLGPEPCLALNPRLVYGRMTGWGQDGPMAMAPGHDINYIALSGALEAIGEAGRPPVLPLNLVGDFGGGGMYLAFGIACALIEAARSGQGQVVDAAMVDGAASTATARAASGRAGVAASPAVARLSTRCTRRRTASTSAWGLPSPSSTPNCFDRPGWTRLDCPTAMTQPIGR